jgi:hypothetical protein
MLSTEARELGILELDMTLGPGFHTAVPALAEQSLRARREPMVRRLTAGGRWIRTIGPAEKEMAVERRSVADHRRLARRPVFNDPIQLIGPGSPSATTRGLSQERDR